MILVSVLGYHEEGPASAGLLFALLCHILCACKKAAPFWEQLISNYTL